jgi:hypothetical protein
MLNDIAGYEVDGIFFCITQHVKTAVTLALIDLELIFRWLDQ